jgi:thioredoxin reductase (NADPH)
MAADSNVDCLIVGGGPAGLTAATYLARFRRNVLLVDAGTSRAALIPKTRNYPGFADGISGPDLLKAQWEQAERNGAQLMHGTVDALRTNGNGGFSATVGNRRVAAAKVLLATGIVDTKPNLPSMREFIYRGAIRFCPVCDAFEATDKTIGVLGPAKHALKKAIFLRTYSRNVVLLPLGDIDLGDDEHRQLRDAGIEMPDEPVADLIADGDDITAVMASGARRTVDVLYPSMGADVRSDLATELGARANNNACLFVDGELRTSVSGLYAAGDITLELHQISVATGQAAIAATDIHNSLPRNPR